MKKAVVLISLLMAGFNLSAREKVELPARKSVELTYEEFEEYDVKLMNRSGKEVNVSVLDARTGKQVSGFGLRPMGNAVLHVAPGNILKLKNTSSKGIPGLEVMPGEVRYPGAVLGSEKNHLNSSQKVPFFALFLVFKLLFYCF